MDSTKYRPRVFIGSSREVIDLANAVHSHLSYDCDVNVWFGDTFKPNEFTMESLEIELDNSDFGVFIFAPDDVAIIRGNPVYTTRDNTIFEMGLFYGKLGRSRVFAIIPDSVTEERDSINDKQVTEYHLLSDFNGITLLKYENMRRDDNYNNATSVAAHSIQKSIAKLGAFASSDKELEMLKSKFDKNIKILHFFNRIHKYGKRKINKQLTQQLQSIADNICSAFHTSDHIRAAGAAMWKKGIVSNKEAISHVAGNVGRGRIYYLEDDYGDTIGVVKAYKEKKWNVLGLKKTLTMKDELDDPVILCYYLDNDIVLSIHFLSNTGFQILSDHVDKMVNDNKDLFKSIKAILGGETNG